MTIQDFLNVRKGTFKSITIESTHGLLTRGKTEGLVKIVKMVARVGIDYSKMKVNNGRQVGELPWGHWVIPNYLIEHKGTQYIRLYPSTNPKHKVEVTYLLNGEIKEKQWLIDNKYISANESQQIVITPKLIHCLQFN